MHGICNFIKRYASHHDSLDDSSAHKQLEGQAFDEDWVCASSALKLLQLFIHNEEAKEKDGNSKVMQSNDNHNRIQTKKFY